MHDGWLRTTNWHILLFTYLSTYHDLQRLEVSGVYLTDGLVLLQGNKVFQCPFRLLKDFDKERVRGSCMQAILVKITLGIG